MAGNARAAAARVIGEVLEGKSLNQALPAHRESVSAEQRPLLQQLCFGTLRQAPRLQALLTELLEKPLKPRDRDIEGLLLCGLYQLNDLRAPDHAVVSTTVAATRALHKPWAKGLTNAVLRRYIREAEALNARLEPAAADSHPAWLYRKLHRQWPGDAAQMIAANNGQPPMTLRINAAKISLQSYLAGLRTADIAATGSGLSPQAVRLEHACPVEQLPGFTDGEVSVQDEAAQLAASILATAPGERVLDACAAPGGKACHILELQPQLKQLVAMDIDAGRLQKVADNCRRLKLDCSLLQGDATAPPTALEIASFDAILIDAPCSASGVIRRHPDVKLLRREADLPQFAARQLSILHGLWPLLRPGGRMLYATCSVFEEENQGVIAQFLREQPLAVCESSDLPWGIAVEFGRQLLPAVDGPDGLYYALLLHRESVIQQTL